MIGLSRLKAADWQKLRAELAMRQVNVVALDVPTSWPMATTNTDEFTSRMFQAINSMMLDVLAAVARKDYDDRRRRQQQGISKAKDEGKFKGRPENTERNADMADMLAEGKSWNTIQRVTSCSRATLAKVAKRSRATAHEIAAR